VATLVFWSLHLITGFAALLFFALSWRVGLTMLICLALDFLLLVWMTIPAPIWHQLVFLLGLGGVVGLPLSLGRGRHTPWQLPTLAGVVLLTLRSVLLLGALATVPDLAIGRLLPGAVVAVLGFPLGLFLGSLAAELGRAALRRFRAWGSIAG
jgi:hypothetical protein